MVSSGGTSGYGGGRWVDVGDVASVLLESSMPPLASVLLAPLDVSSSVFSVPALGGGTSGPNALLTSPTRLRIGNTRSTVKSVGGMKTTAFGDSRLDIACWHL